MALGADLKREFSALAKGKRKEIDLFRAFINAFNSLGATSISKEYHGNSYQVTFNQSRGAGRPQPRCELCDVVIIQYPKGNAQSARITFNQAKVTDKRHFSTPPRKTAPYSFRANLEQWDLLAHRPIISSAVKKFKPAPNLLSDALLPSVGSFGVFYPTTTNFDFAYFVAKELLPVNNNKSASGTLYMSCPMHSTHRISGYPETTGCSCFIEFGKALEEGLIGSPIQPMLNNNTQKQVRSWLSDLLSDLHASNPASAIPKELASGLELNIDESIAQKASTAKRPSIRAVIAIKTEG
ncbi:MAG: hypothetical protein VX870_06475 [Pseudomonadota bacterium]|nr:hypothetical protein [Pseudomonadota bacterium]